MKPEIRDFIGKHQLFFESIQKEESIENIAAGIGVSTPTVYSFLEKSKAYGLVERQGKKDFLVNIGNFIGIYIKDNKIQYGIFDSYLNEITFKEKYIAKDSNKKIEISTILKEMKEKYSFLYTSVVVNTGVKDESIIGLGAEADNMFLSSMILSKEDCIFVNSNIIKMIYIKEFIDNNSIYKGSNLVYYDLKLRQFSVLEDNQLKERTYDEYYGILPYYKEQNEVMQKLLELSNEEYDEYYQANKEKIFDYFSQDIRSILHILRPDAIYLTCEILKPEYVKESNIYSDIDTFWVSEILGRYNAYIKPILFTKFTDREMLKAAAKYAQYKFLNWKLKW